MELIHPPADVTAAFFFMLILSTITIVFFLGLLLRVEPGWSQTKILHFTLHFNDLIFIVSKLITFSAVLAADEKPTAAQCALPSILHDFTAQLQPLCLAVMAHIRWKVLSTVTAGSTTTAKVPPQEPNLKLYFAIAFGFALISTIVNNVVTGTPYLWVLLYCLRLTSYWGGLRPTLFIVCAIYIYFRYYQVMKIMGAYGGNNETARELSRVLVVVTTWLYVSQIPFNVWLILWNTEVITRQPRHRHVVIFSFLYAGVSPILSIMLTPRWRKAAKNFLMLKGIQQHLSRSSGRRHSKISKLDTAVQRDVSVQPA